jgi:protocatechuate 3,4-dioxygenase beta subunit
VKRPSTLVFPLLAFLAVPLHAVKIPVTGRVLTPDGKAAPGVRVALIPIVSEVEFAKLDLSGKTGPAPAAAVSTGPAGAFQLTAPDAGMWKVRLEASGCVPLEALLLPLLEEAELPDAQLVPDAGFQVKVTGDRGQPVGQAWVRLEGSERKASVTEVWRLPLRRAAWTDANGSVTFPRPAGESLTVWAVAPGFLPGEQKDVRGGGASLRLAPGPVRQIQIRDPQGKGIPGVFVSATETGWRAGRTSAQGLLELTVPAAGVDLRLLAEDGRRLTYRLKAAKPGEEGPAVAVLKPVSPMGGKVVSARDGRPLPGALAWTSDDLGVTARAGADGTFRLAGSAEGELAVFAAAPGFFRADGRAEGGQVPTLALQPRLTAAGVVVDEAGRPVADALLKAVLLPGAQVLRDPSVYSSGGSTRSAASGRFRFSRLAAGAAYELRITRQGFAPARAETPVREPGTAAPELRIVLHAGRTAFGTVTDGGRRPVAGAQVSLQPPAPASFSARMRALRDPERLPGSSTDAAGRFEVKDLPGGTFDLVVRARGFAPLTVPSLAVPEGKAAVDLGTVVLAPGAPVRGLVVDARGNPVEGAEVRAQAAVRSDVPDLTRRFRDPGPADAVTAADGSFVLADRSPGESLDLGVTHPGYGPGSAPGVAVPAETPVRIVLQPTARVAGHAHDPDGKPVAGAVVLLSEEMPVSFGGRSELMNSNRFQRMTTDDEGSFAFDGVSPGPFHLRAQAAGRQEAELRNLEVKPGQDLANLEIVLPPGAAIEGRVLSPEGKPVSRAIVAVLQESANRFVFTPQSRAAAPDGDGRYRIDGVPPGQHTVEARAEGYRRAVRNVEVVRTTPVDFALERGLEVSGRVMDGAGTAIPGAQVMLVSGGDVFHALGALSEADGSFHISGLQDGTYQLMAEKDGYAPDFKGQPVTLAGVPVSGLEVRLSGGGTVTGRLTGLEFSQLSRVRVWANSAAHLGQVDPEGVYRIPNLPPGSWTVSATVPDTPLHAQGEVTLEPGAAEARLDLQLGGGHTLSGVVLSNGQPLAGAALSLERAGAERQTAATGHEGSFRFGGLEDGVYDLAVSTPKGALHQEKVELAGDREIRVELRTASLSGRVIDGADSSPVPGARIALASKDGSQSPFGESLTDGRGIFHVLEVGDGAWTVKATREGYAPAEREVRVDGSPLEDLEIRLEPTEGVTVEALMAAGQPPERIRVAALDAGGRVVASGTYPTGENGRTRISNVPPGSWLLLVEADPSAPVTLSATVPGPAVHAVLPPAGQVRIQIPALANDPVEAKAVLTGAGGVYRDFDWDGSVKSEWPFHNGGTNLPRVPAGVWQVTARAADGRTWSGTVTVAPGGVAEVGLK